MSCWPHAPCHVFNTAGTYIVTGSTLNKQLLFKSPDELNLLQTTLFQLADHYNWRLEAWAIFPNHYHFIAHSPNDPATLCRFITHFHAISARELNLIQNQPGRTVWYQYWDTHLTYHKSYLARLNYVMQNPVKHRIVHNAQEYPWCSVRWFSQNTSSSYQKVVASYKTDTVKIMDDF